MSKRIVCPATTCRAESSGELDDCARCGTPLRSYARLMTHSAQLFNQGLAAARAGELARARDLFAAVVHWHPIDLEARNALAMACLALGDRAAASSHWETVLARSPTDALASRGRAALAGAPASDAPAERATPARPKKGASDRPRKGGRPGKRR